MKCPHCGHESQREDVCSICGEKMEVPDQTIEVEYKEFKVSEFMEIRKKRRNSQKGHQKTSAEGAGKEGKGYRPAGNTGIAGARISLLQGDKRKRFLVVVLVLIVLAAMTGAYYLLKFFITGRF